MKFVFIAKHRETHEDFPTTALLLPYWACSDNCCKK